MAIPAIYADFMNADTAGRVRLNTIGTMEDLSRLGLCLIDGMRIVVYDEELEADGVAAFSADEHVWVAVIDWNAVRQVPETSPSHKV